MSIQNARDGHRTSRATAQTALIGRDDERARLEQEMRKVRDGQSTVVVLRGDPGIGKTALVERAAGRARGFRVIRARGVESERRFPYAALQLLCAPLVDHLGRLQAPRREALCAAVAAGTGAQPDPFLVGLATLDLLTYAADGRPLLWIVDDAQWIDRPTAEVLAFVARRLEARPIMVLLAARDTPRVGELDDLPELRLQGLSPGDLRLLLGRMLPGRMDQPVVERIVEEARGHPHPVLELVHGVTPAALAGGFGVPSARERRSASDDDELDRMSDLPPDSRRLLLAAAAEPTGDPSLVWRAAAHLGIAPYAGEPLESGGLLEFGARIAFCRPLLRSVVYGAAAKDERRTVHRALASAMESGPDPARRTWHLAQAADGPDEELARELEASAPSARQRGGSPAAAAFLEQAYLLTAEPRHRVDRALAAAAAQHEAGADNAAVRLLHSAEMGPLDERQQTRLERQYARIAVATKRGDDATERLLGVARRLESLEPTLAREAYLEALEAAISAGRLGLARTAVDVAKAAQAGPPAVPPRRAVDLLLDGLVDRFTQGSAAAGRPLARALQEFGRAGTGEESTRWGRLASAVAAELWDDAGWQEQTSLDLRLTRDTGALAVLPAALDNRAVAELFVGRFAAAARLIGESAAVNTTVGALACPRASVLLAAWRGHEHHALGTFDTARRHALERGDGLTLATVGLAAAVLYNSLGRHDEALAAAREATELDDLVLHGWTLVELVEAAVRAHEPDAAELALQRLCERTQPTGSDWALGIVARSRALLGDGPAAEPLFQEAIDRLGRSRITSYLARTELVYGEWLRRQGRRLDAREPLRAARTSFEAMGASAFAERAHRELLATGEKVRSRSVESSGQLTPQEARIAFLARDGLSNPEIAARIFVSPRTVEYHLHKVFSKLGITSRNELHIVLSRAAADAGHLPGTAVAGTPPPTWPSARR